MQEPKKRGRPPKPAAERRRHNQTFRCNDEMLAKLQEAADKNQRSLSEEVERRIEESFSKENLIEDFRSVSYTTSEQAWNDYVKKIAGEQRFLSFGLDAASTLRYAMRDLDIFESKISDIVKSKDHLDFITQKFLHQLPAMLKWVDSSEFNSAVEITKNAMRRSFDEALDVKDEE